MFSGCASVSTVMYNDKDIYPETDPQEIKVFNNIRPPRDYIEIGEIRVESPVYDIVETIEKLRVRVAKMGGEAVILRPNEAKGIVIRFKE
jgi:hypothetical protein